MLKPSDFSEFFKEIHGHTPFSWQIELANRVCEKGWPKALDMPTASGKTAVIDIAVFYLALEAKKTVRNAHMRIAFVVDRRLVVDDAFDHAKKIADTILKSENKICKDVSKALQDMSSSGMPLTVVKLRGGIPQESDWAKTPAQPLVIISTVDQVGSRLLFRGYGVSSSMRPIHAGLLGTDTFFILDEAHTAQPFLNTLDEIKKIRHSKWNSNSRSFEVMFMSATLPQDKFDDDIFPPKKDRMKLLSDDGMRKRMGAHKYAKLIKVKLETLEKTISDEAINFAETENIKTVGVVVNRVKIARDVYKLIKEKSSNENEVHLLIGCSRPIDRDTFVKDKINELKNKENIPEGKTIFFVATQCVEVGVDVSFDALVTQIASLDAIRQRFGRLNRIGEYDTSEARIIASGDDIKKSDFIYQNASKNTWKYLWDKSNKGKNTVDFGINYFEDPENIEELIMPKMDTLKILTSYIDFWTQTKPAPSPDPDPALFLHGMGSKSADVQVIWRADIAEDCKNKGTLISTPSILETISIPIWAVKKWLAQEGDCNNHGDIEGTTYESVNKSNPKKTNKKRDVLRWRGKKDNNTKWIPCDDIQPGDTILVPATYGGCDQYGWDDTSEERVTDVGMESNLIHRQRITMRFDEALVNSSTDSKIWEHLKKATIEHEGDDDLEEFFNEIKKIEIPQQWKNMIDVLEQDGDYSNKKLFEVEKIEENNIPRITGFAYKKRLNEIQIRQIFEKSEKFKSLEHIQNELSNTESSTEENESYVNSKKINLQEHCIGVKKFVEKFGNCIGMNSQKLDDLKLVGLLHDAGKAERRVQAFFQGLDPDELPDELHDDNMLAKTTYEISNGIKYKEFLKKAHLPKGYRHECWSVSLAKNHPKVKKAHNSELVKYLIGTHHGYGRPLFPPVDDLYADDAKFMFDGVLGHTKHNLIQMDSDWIETVREINSQYDPWELAHMESIIRLADHRQSEEEQDGN